MKKGLFLLIPLVVCLTSWAQGSLSETHKAASEIVNEVQKGKALLVDVRTPDEFNGGHLKYAKNIDFKAIDFGQKIIKLDKSLPIYLYCRSGNRSGKAELLLKEAGYTKVYNIGGFEDLKLAGLPSAQQ